MSQHKPLARIYQPPKSAMQSGRANTHEWVLDYEPAEAKVLDPLTGWVGSGDMLNQVRLRFDTREEAIAFAEARAIAYEAEPAQAAGPVKAKVYADNFRFGRSENWSH